MAADPPPPRAAGGGGGLSLYANLLESESNAPGSISRAPVVSQEAIEAVKEQEASKKTVASALRFQPHQQIRRPQQKTQKPKPAFPKILPLSGNSTSTPTDSEKAPNPVSAPPVKSSLADWAGNEDDEYMYAAAEKRARGGRRKKKKKLDAMPMETDWDEIYDPSRPTNVDEYLRSDERIREVREWKALLYKHRRRDNERDSWDSDEEDDHRPVHNQFAPPDSYSFAPPPPSPPRAPLPDDKSGDDAYARRLAMSQGQAPPPPRSPTPPPPPPPPAPEPNSSTISREPVRYVPPQQNQAQKDPDAMDLDHEDDGAEYAPPGPPAMDDDDGVIPRVNRPGQKGFAARLMSKYGWSKGQGLGAEGSGIIQPLRVEVEKRKKKSDAEGGGWAGPGGRGKIIGSKTAAGTSSSTSESAGKFGPMSNVIVLRNMLDGMEDIQTEMENGLGQEIGEECGDQYGRVERVHIDTPGRRVFIKFTDQVSALRAVNALDGRIFAGNAIVPEYYDPEKFDRKIYE
ncbi:putative G-patch domain-containing protein [Rosellinia necatrix]|uniref:Putative G-patch domain-containing protein n=1 Tax=Rosellinia necatrix TaxID=77044 RepID=A0A1S7UJ74_ROSNE|nr:putative G-patch domain-containing protein [Rosellinia necatrix]